VIDMPMQKSKYIKCERCKAMLYHPSKQTEKCRCGGKFKRVSIKNLNMRATIIRQKISKLSFEIGELTDELMDIRTTISIVGGMQKRRPDEGIEINGSGPSRDKKRWWMNITLWSDGPRKPRVRRGIQ